MQDFRDINDNDALNTKKAYKGEAIYGKAQAYDQLNDNTYAVTTIAKAVPARIISSSVDNGFNAEWIGTAGLGSTRGGFLTGSTITNIHHDTYGRDQEVPLQGPFTNKYVGGKQSRHVRLNPGTDNFTNRPEEWRILIGKAGNPTPLTGAFGFVAQDYPFPDIGRDPIAATGVVTFANAPAPTDGDTITISDGVNTTIFEFDTNGSVTAGRTAVDISGASNADQRATALRDAVNSVSGLYVSSNTDGVNVNLENTRYGAPTSVGNAILGTVGNVAITTSLTGVPLTVTGMSGGKDPIILNYHAPKATRYREELVKRPVNIKNILQTTASVDTVISDARDHGPIGNYRRNYEIVQTSPRSVNNLYLREPDQAVLTKSEIDMIRPRKPMMDEGREWVRDYDTSGIQDATLPTRTTNETVIVTRFSAPGGFESISRGYLDPVHEEMSPNDVTTFRNRLVRGHHQYIATSVYC